jgi:hypothetical protein
MPLNQFNECHVAFPPAGNNCHRCNYNGVIVTGFGQKANANFKIPDG